MKIKVKLQFIKSQSGPKIFVPFWFTRDKSLHLSHLKPEVELEMDSLNAENIYQIMLGVKKSLIQVTPKDEFDKECSKMFDTKTAKKAADIIKKTQEVDKAPVKPKEIAKRKSSKKAQEANAILKMSVANVSKEVGSGKLNEEGLVPNGMNDMELLLLLLEKENKTKNPRKGIISSVQARIDILDNHGISVTGEEIAIEEEEHKKLVIDNEKQIITELDEPIQEADEPIKEDK